MSLRAIGKVILEKAKMVNVFTITRNFTSVIGCMINDMGKENIFTIIKNSGTLEIGAMICDMERASWSPTAAKAQVVAIANNIMKEDFVRIKNMDVEFLN